VTSERRIAGWLLALLGVVGFSLSLPLTKIALRGFDPWQIALGRSAIAGLLALGVLLLLQAPPPRRDQLPGLLAVVAGVVLGFPLLSTLALQSTTAVHAAVVIAALPIVTATLGVTRSRERMGIGFWVASAIGTGAVMLFALSRGGMEGGGLVPDLLLFGAVLAAAVGYVAGGRLSRFMPGWQTISWAMVIALPLSLPAFAISLALDPPSPTRSSTTALFLLALVVQYAAFFAFYSGLARGGVARVSQVQLIQPLLTLGWSVLLLGETVTIAAAATSLLVVVAIAWTQRRRPAPSPPD
jgi:drug/metabolite transporter (DMT)-like permease